MTKKIRLVQIIALFLIIGGHLCWAQQIKGPSMHLVEETFDAQEVMEGSVIEHSFKVLNQGDSPLEITKVKTS